MTGEQFEGVHGPELTHFDGTERVVPAEDLNGWTHKPTAGELHLCGTDEFRLDPMENAIAEVQDTMDFRDVEPKEVQRAVRLLGDIVDGLYGHIKGLEDRCGS